MRAGFLFWDIGDTLFGTKSLQIKSQVENEEILGGKMLYNYEAEVISNSVRKNSKLSTITTVITEVTNEKLKTEGCGGTVDEENAKRVAESIMSAVFGN